MNTAPAEFTQEAASVWKSYASNMHTERNAYFVSADCSGVKFQSAHAGTALLTTIAPDHARLIAAELIAAADAYEAQKVAA